VRTELPVLLMPTVVYGSLKISTAIDNAIKSDASAYLEFVKGEDFKRAY
jgi:hypothetical protein